MNDDDRVAIAEQIFTLRGILAKRSLVHMCTNNSKVQEKIGATLDLFSRVGGLCKLALFEPASALMDEADQNKALLRCFWKMPGEDAAAFASAKQRAFATWEMLKSYIERNV
jgi:hypothetical protein